MFKNLTIVGLIFIFSFNTLFCSSNSKICSIELTNSDDLLLVLDEAKKRSIFYCEEKSKIYVLVDSNFSLNGTRWFRPTGDNTLRTVQVICDFNLLCEVLAKKNCVSRGNTDQSVKGQEQSRIDRLETLEEERQRLPVQLALAACFFYDRTKEIIEKHPRTAKASALAVVSLYAFCYYKGYTKLLGVGSLLKAGSFLGQKWKVFLKNSVTTTSYALDNQGLNAIINVVKI